ncbi:MAG: transglutaminase-like domain-containing protein [Planctomycetota bacterium]
MTTPPAYCRPAAFEAFRREAPAAGDAIGLLRAATAIALHADPDASIDGAVRTVGRLSESVRRRLRSDSQPALLAHLHDVLFEVVGFRGAEGADYYNPDNSYLPRVLQTRRGIPISLVLLYRAVAAPLGLRVEGVNAPGHFLAAVYCQEPTGEQQMYVDPFYSGALLSRDEAIARVESVTGGLPQSFDASAVDVLGLATPRAWLGRMLLNLQAIFARSGQERDLLAMQELASLLPEE